MSDSASAAPTSTNLFFSRSWLIMVLLIGPVLAAMFVYQLDSLEPAPMPVHEFTGPAVTAELRNERMLQGSEAVGLGELHGPEDLVYDAESGMIYTGCEDGWIKRVKLNDSVDDSVIEDWIHTGGRPLGIALGKNKNEIVVADSYKGLLKISGDSAVVLTDEAQGRKFMLTDAVDIANDGTIYFTDASYRYHVREYIWDILEGRPNGRLLSYDPVTQQTKVLLSDLYFANGVVVSPDQTHVIFCETPMRRCRKYYINGEKSGSVEKFVENLPGVPDNIHYDGEGHYLIAVALEFSKLWELALRYPVIRKVRGLVLRYLWMPKLDKNGGGFVVDLEGKPVAHYYDPGVTFISSTIKVRNHLYFGSIHNPYILRVDVNQHPAQAII